MLRFKQAAKRRVVQQLRGEVNSVGRMQVLKLMAMIRYVRMQYTQFIIYNCFKMFKIPGKTSSYGAV